MFWRFGFHNGSTIDSLLDNEDVSLEAILDEDDLVQECKSQNTRLIDYFGRVEVLQKLFGYVTGQIESEEKRGFKYPYVATEVLCSDLWSIVETCLTDEEHLLVPFWETVLDRPPEDMKTEMIMASHFAKINAAFFIKKPAEMLGFIQSQPSVVERLLRHVEMPAFVDLIVRIIQLDEQPSGEGVLEWLSSEDLMGRLIELLSPEHAPDVHTVVADLIKGMVSMAAPSPGAGLTEGQQDGPASNRFARELACKHNISTLVSYMLHDFHPPPAEDNTPTVNNTEHDFNDNETLPNLDSFISSVANSISVVIELIRKNNSDYFEPYLFHNLRTRLIQVQQQLHMHSDDGREQLENAMKEMVNRMRVVHLGPVLEVLSPRLEEFQLLLKKPRSLAGRISLTVGNIVPLTLERLRICELFAELLHCSNMSLLNRPASANGLYDSEGCLQGGLCALEELAQFVTATNTSERGGEAIHNSDNDEGDDDEDAAPVMDLPISSNTSHDSPSIDSDDSMSDGDEPGSSDDEAMEEIAIFDEPQSQISTVALTSDRNVSQFSSSTNIASITVLSNPFMAGSEGDISVSPSASGRCHKRKTVPETSLSDLLPVGEELKRKYLDLNVMSSLLDLFFEFPWNNFVHSAVYDLLHQVLTGNFDSGHNRDLIISLFRDARLIHRILEGQKRNDVENTKQKGVRFGYMGHLTLISEDVIAVLSRFPLDLQRIVEECSPSAAWEQYVTGRYDETRKRDSRQLGGGKPTLSGSLMGGRRRVDEGDDDDLMRGTGPSIATRGEFKRTGAVARRSTADFGPVPAEEEEEANHDTHFARYLAEEINTFDQFGYSSSDDDDDEGGWLSQSTFILSNPPVSARRSVTERQPLEMGNFEDSFDPSREAPRTMIEDPFNPHEDDGFGPFSDAVTGTDPFVFPTSLSDEMEDASFDSFGDFGDFQSAEEGEGDLTPTTGSWTLASDSNIGGEG